MSDLTKFSDGASILQQVDVSDIFKNLALGIAEAQQKLDDNSIAQAIKLAQTQINGVSLLELGFAPVFYAFQYADISASINLKMALKEELEFGFGLDLQLAGQKGYTEDSHEFLSEDNYSETTDEYKSSRQVSFRANEKNAVKINNTFVKQSESLNAKSRLEKFKYDIVHEAGVDQVYDEVHSKKITNNQSRGVDAWMDGGFFRLEQGIHYGVNKVGVLKIKSFSGSVDIDNDSQTPNFNLTTDMLSSLPVATSGSGSVIYGLSKSGDLYNYNGTNWVQIPSKIYFGYNSEEIAYGKDLKDGPTDANQLTYSFQGGFTNKNHDAHYLIHRVLRLIQSKDSDASITITGMTDPKGGDNPKNQSLAKRRAEKLRDHIFGSNAPVNVKIDAVTNESGNSDLLKRYAKVELDSDYMIFINGNITKNATAASPNAFVYSDDFDGGNKPFNTLNLQYGSVSLAVTNSTFSEIVSEAQTKISNHAYELTSDGKHYFLDNEAIVKLSMYTNQAEEIAIESNDESSSNGTENSNTYLFSKTKNEKSLLSDTTAKKSQDNSFALGASVDFRMSRQFEMSMEGNASMSARLVSVPAPQGFVVFLQNVFIETQAE